MLLPYSCRLRSSCVRIVLASTSPRRRELMALLLPSGGAAAGGLPFACVPSSFAEDLPHSAHESAASYALATCAAKAEEVWARVAADTDVLIAADTVVVRDGVILEKPQSAEHAFAMLRSLSGRTHQVVTGVTLLFHGDADADADVPAPAGGAAPPPPPREVAFSVQTDVTFAHLDDDVIRMYVDSNEPMDKAGGYGYQSVAATMVREISGCYYNVVGFPLHQIAAHLRPHLDRVIAAAEKRQAKAQASATVPPAAPASASGANQQ